MLFGNASPPYPGSTQDTSLPALVNWWGLPRGWAGPAGQVGPCRLPSPRAQWLLPLSSPRATNTKCLFGGIYLRRGVSRVPVAGRCGFPGLLSFCPTILSQGSKWRQYPPSCVSKVLPRHEAATSDIPGPPRLRHPFPSRLPAPSQCDCPRCGHTPQTRGSPHARLSINVGAEHASVLQNSASFLFQS